MSASPALNQRRGIGGIPPGSPASIGVEEETIVMLSIIIYYEKVKYLWCPATLHNYWEETRVKPSRHVSRFVGENIGRELENTARRIMLELQHYEEGLLGSHVRSSWLVKYCPSERIREAAFDVWDMRVADEISEEEAIRRLDELIAECVEDLGEEEVAKILNSIDWL